MWWTLSKKLEVMNWLRLSWLRHTRFLKLRLRYESLRRAEPYRIDWQVYSRQILKYKEGLATGYSMKKKLTDSKAAVTAAEIERSIQALNKMAERLWGDGREAEAKALLDALDALNRALDRIRIGESRRVFH